MACEQLTRLGDVIELEDVKREPISSRDRKDRKGSYPYYGAQGIVDYLDDYTYEGDYLLVAEDGENLRSRKNPIANAASGKFRVNNHAHVIAESEKCNLVFLRHLLNMTDISAYVTGSTQPKLSQSNLCAMKLPLPSMAEQNAIANVLSLFDRKIELNNQLNDYLEQLCQSLFDRFDNDENNLFVKVSDIADVNPRRTLKKGEEALCVEMADLSTTGAFPTDWRTKAYNGGVKFVNGDTILARITPCLENGKAGYINFLEQDEVAFGSTEYIVLTSKGELPSEFFYFLARNEDFISYATAHMNGSSGRQRVSGADVGNYEVRMPSEKQVSEFKEIAGKAMRVISASSIESRKLAQSCDALLPKLMSGEIDVSEVDLTQPTNNHLADY